MAGTVLAVSCRALIEYAEKRGHSTTDWLREAGVTAKELDDPDRRLDPAVIFALWRRGYEALGDSALALHVAESLPRGAYRAVEYLAAHAPTLGHAYTKLADYFSVIDATTELVIDSSVEYVAFGPRRVGDPSSYPAVEYMLAACYLRVREMTGVSLSPIAVEFAASPKEHTEEIERVFGCPVLWSTSGHRLRFKRSDWNRPTAEPDPELLSVLEDHARILRERNPSSTSLVQVLDRILEQAWNAEEPGVEDTARKLGMSSRTLQRRLEEEGTTFAARVDEARKRKALHWLQCKDVALSEVAYLVGFQEQASLTRAVRRWTGKTPSQLRSGREN